MKKIKKPEGLIWLMALGFILFLSIPVSWAANTPYLNLEKIPAGTTNWHLNEWANMDKLDAAVGPEHNTGGTHKTIHTDDIIAKKPWFDVRAFGAVGDGVTDDTASIQAALNAATGAGGGVVFFPVGTYKVTSTLITYSYVTMLGQGYKSKIEQSTAFTMVSGTNLSHAVFDSLWFKGVSNTSPTSNHNGINICSSTDTIVRNSIVEGFSYTGIFSGGSSARNLIIGNWVLNNGNIGLSSIPGAGIQLGGTQHRCMGNFVMGNYANGIDNNASNTTIANNICYQNGQDTGLGSYDDRAGITVSGAAAAEVTVRGNVCLANGNATRNKAGIYIEGNAKRVTVVGNTCRDDKGDGIRVVGDYHTVTGNNCYSNNGSGIAAVGADRSIFEGNICDANGIYGVDVNGANNIVNENIVTNNISYGILVNNNNNIINYNQILGNSGGISVQSGSGNQIFGNKFQ